MALYYYINISLSRINLKKSLGGKIYIEKYNLGYIILLYIEKLTSGQKKKERDYPIYIEKYNNIYIEKIQTDILYPYIYKRNTNYPLGENKKRKDIYI